LSQVATVKSSAYFAMFSKESTRPPGGDRAKYAGRHEGLWNGSCDAFGRNRRMLNATVVFQIEDDLVLSPDFLLLGEKWFPNWRTDHIAAFRTLIAAFTTLDHHGSFDLDFGEVLLDGAAQLAHGRRQASYVSGSVPGMGNRDDSKRWKASSKEPLPTWKVRRNLSLKGT